MDIVKTPPTLLVILDGFGYKKEQEGNAIAHAHMPCWKNVWEHYPRVLLHASGEHVGLLPGFIGNSEVGHLTLGAGKIVQSVLKKFHDAIANKQFFSHAVLLRRFEQIRQSGGTLHLMGLLSDGGVHSHEEHLHALITLACQCGLSNVFIHAFLDGRDVPQQSAADYLRRLERVCADVGCGKLASMHGRFFAMDRDKNWQRTQKTFDCLTGVSAQTAQSWNDYLMASYAQGVYDEFVEPIQLLPDAFIKPGDGVVFFNFRPDRARQLTRAFVDSAFQDIRREGLAPSDLAFFVTTTSYHDDFAAMGNEILFERDTAGQTLIDCIHKAWPEEKIVVIAETEKYAHVTYFFHGMKEELQGEYETRVLVPSIKAKTYINHPEMSAAEITSCVVSSLRNNPAFFYLINYANLDMVGHSGDFNAVVKACNFVDQQIGVLYDLVVKRMGGTIFFVGDHGNAEEMIGEHMTSHTTNPVPFVKVQQYAQQQDATLPAPCYGLSHVAGTILHHLEIPIPQEMDDALKI